MSYISFEAYWVPGPSDPVSAQAPSLPMSAQSFPKSALSFPKSAPSLPKSAPSLPKSASSFPGKVLLTCGKMLLTWGKFSLFAPSHGFAKFSLFPLIQICPARLEAFGPPRKHQSAAPDRSEPASEPGSEPLSEGLIGQAWTVPGSKTCPKGVCGRTPSGTLRRTPNPGLHLGTFGHGQQHFWASVRGLIAEFCYSQAAIFETPHAVSRSFRFSP